MKSLFFVMAVILFSVSIVSISAQSQYEIPTWFKGVANFWVEGNISDDEFGESISFLIDNEIVKVPLIQDLRNEISQLTTENIELRSKLDLPVRESTFTDTTSISVQTDDENYDSGDTIVISGKVTAPIEDMRATVQVYIDGSLIEIVQVTIAQDGSYLHTIIAEGPKWDKNDDYTVRATYGDGNVAETMFSYTKSENVQTESFEVDVGSRGTFDVTYMIRGGVVTDILFDADILSLIVQIESTDDGTITLDLPREFIGAEKQDGTDEIFIILVDGNEIPYEESPMRSDSRAITIGFEQGTSEIEILWTYTID